MIIRRLLLFLAFGEGGIEIMAIVYALLIIKGKKTFSDVPAKLKDQVREILIDMECPELAEE